MEIIKQILITIPKGFMQAVLFNGIFITIAYVLIWKIFKKRFQNWRIQVKERVNANQIKTELKMLFLPFWSA